MRWPAGTIGFAPLKKLWRGNEIRLPAEKMVARRPDEKMVARRWDSPAR
jgi:hypothetical protein